MTKVINSPCDASRARVDCQRISSQSGYVHIPSSQTTGARTRVREGSPAIRCREAYFRAGLSAFLDAFYRPTARTSSDEPLRTEA